MAGNFNDNIMVRFTAGSLADTVNGDDFTLLRTCQLYDAWSVAQGATAGTVTISHTSDTAGNEITDAMSVNAADATLTRATTIDDLKNAFTTGQVINVKKSTIVSTSTFALFNATGASLS
jgi:hypothetical protein